MSAAGDENGLMAVRDAAGFDRWYDGMTERSVRDEIVRRALGLPDHFQSSSLLPWIGIADVVAALDLAEGDVLLDVACGRGGYGFEVAGRTGVRLVGVDFSAVAIEQGRRAAAELGLAGRCELRVGDLLATGLEAASVDAAMCIDAIQFADPQVEAIREVRRVLVPGGRVVLTCWEAIDPKDERHPERLRRVHLEQDLTDAGFENVRVVEKPDWHRIERRLWDAALAVSGDGDEGLRSLREEAERTLPRLDAVRRVFATATAPA
jgi:SAM-dependent methyltransferase